MKNISFTILTLLIIISCKPKTEKPQTIDEKVQKALIENDIPSLSIGVVRNGKIDLLKGFGIKSRTDSSKVNKNSIFQIASQSKMLTGIIVNNLILEGKLNLEEPITSYFTNEISENAKNLLKEIKLKYLLNHTSGIPSDACSLYSQRTEGEAWTSGYSRENLINDINKIELNFKPNSQFQYSNSGYAIVGFICENVSGANYEKLLEKYITNKYGLKNTVVSLDDEQKLKLVTPYKKDERKVVTSASIMGMATPASAVYSNANDLTTLLSEQIIAYRQKTEQNPMILTTQTSKMDEGLEYGFGLIKEIKDENIKYGHGGDADGFACEYFFNPKQNTGVVILTSSGGRWIGGLADEILENL